jgi:hypothetical protein
MIAVARLNLNDEEMRELEELITEYEVSFATKATDYRRSERVYRRIYAGEPRPIRQPPRRLILEDRSGQNARGHVPAWSYRKVKQTQDIVLLLRVYCAIS